MSMIHSPEAKAFVTGGTEAFGFRVPSIGSFMGNGSRYILGFPAGPQLLTAESALLNAIAQAELTVLALLRQYMDVDTFNITELVDGAAGVEAFTTEGNFHTSLYRAIDLLVDYDRLVHLAKRNPDVGLGRDETIRTGATALIRAFKAPRKLLEKKSRQA